jgi:3D (Asp-Asp-Asp) domain-containing protein
MPATRNLSLTLLRSGLVTFRHRLLPVPVAVLVGAFLAVSLAGSGGADSAPALLQRAHDLRAANTALAARTHAALLRLYSLDAQLARAQARLDALSAQAEAVRRERVLTAKRLRIARHDAAAAEAQLGARLRQLYEQGQTDPLAVLLGAQSLDDALAGLDALDRSASLDRQLIQETRLARAHEQAASTSLAARSATLERLRRDAAATASAIAATRAQQSGYLASLRSKERLNGARISSLERAARAAQAKSVTLVAAPAAPTAPAVAGANTMTVVATGYSGTGATATGLATGWGVVAVDPSVIPLGTQMSIPGYGDGVAADVGSAVSGAAIDLWFPSDAQARAWGRRTVTIALH